jgi:K+-sensing histidine kinase KdpD
VDNACKYAASAEDRRIHLDIGLADGDATIALSDHGPGVRASDAWRVFQPFRKSAQAAANSAPGVGLGLALSRRLAADAGGRLALADANSGACFVLTLPLADTHG